MTIQHVCTGVHWVHMQSQFKIQKKDIWLVFTTSSFSAYQFCCQIVNTSDPLKGRGLPMHVFLQRPTLEPLAFQEQAQDPISHFFAPLPPPPIGISCTCQMQGRIIYILL